MKMKMHDMKMSKAETKAMNEPMETKGPEYPYGLRLNLDKASLDKLGIKDLPAVGNEMHLMAACKVTSVSQSASENNEHSSMELQIMSMGLDSEMPSENKDSATTEKTTTKTNTIMHNAYRGSK